MKTQAGHPFQVFTPNWKACLNTFEPETPALKRDFWEGPSDWPESIPLKSLQLEPAIDWAGGLGEAWKPGEAGASEQLNRFLAAPIRDYPEEGNFPSRPGTARLSPHLHFGEIGPRQIWQAAKKRSVQGSGRGTFHGTEVFLREIGWREFAHHLLFHFPQTSLQPLRAEFARFPWLKNKKALKIWQKGRTGYPIVDAAMRELWATGWMHNRMRMVAASFLVKDLRISCQEGARWFWDTLVDADLANNTLGWQWVAGCGADAAPYFRVFSPVLQGEKFDADGDYVRR